MLAWGDDHVAPNASCFQHGPLRDIRHPRILGRLNTDRPNHPVRTGGRVISAQLGFDAASSGMVRGITQHKLPCVTARGNEQHGQE